MAAMSTTSMALGPAGQAIFQEIGACADPRQLDAIGSRLWGFLADGHLTDGEATWLSSEIEHCRPLRRGLNPINVARPVRSVSRYLPRQRPRSPDRKASRDRRRMLGGSSAMPDTMRADYTEGQRAVLCVIAGEVKRQNICDMPIDKIAALAGVCRTSVQTALHEARRLGHIKITERPQRGRKSLTNIVEIIAEEWLAWIKRAPSEARLIGSNSIYGSNLVSPTKNKEKKEEGKKGCRREEKRVWQSASLTHPAFMFGTAPPNVTPS